MVRVSCLLLSALVAVLARALPSQEPETGPTTRPDSEQRERLISALDAFTEAFVTGRLLLTGSFLLGQEHPLFGSETQPGGLLYLIPEKPKGKQRRVSRRRGRKQPTLYPRSNHWALQRLLDIAERQPSVPVATAVLAVAAVGLNSNLYDPKVMQVRELGHWTLMRMDDSKVWLFLTRVAAGATFAAVPWLKEQAAEEGRDPTLRVAALRLLGDKNHSVFRPLVETGLASADPRVRLAAAEALYRMASRRSFPVLVRALSTERHGVVQHALLHAISRILRKRGGIAKLHRDRAVRACLRLLGNTEWRVEMSAVDMIAKHPLKESIPELIDVMERQEKDLLKQLVNRNASPLLQRKAWEALRGLTGASLPKEAKAWHEFWEKNRDTLTIVDRDRMRQMPKGRRTKATFYGIPVEGGDVAFVIDTSGSMDAKVHGTVERKWRRGRARMTRLEHAKAQMQTAAQTMDTRTRYHLYTFASKVTKWNLKPVPANDRSLKALTACLGHLEAGGGTNVFDALMKVLEAENVKFGERPKGVVDEIFVLSDGEPTAGAVRDPEEILEVVKEINRYLKVRINTVYTGQGAGAEFMRDLAKQNGGVFVQK